MPRDTHHTPARPKVRRFEMGASAFGFDGFLKDRGFKVNPHGPSTFKVVGPKGGRPKTMSRAQMIDLLDDEREKSGLQTIRKQRNS